MEKTLTIDGKQVRFKSTGAIAKRYKAQFGTDFFADIFKMDSLMKVLTKGKKLKVKDFENLDFDVLYNLLWTLAKTADKDIPDPITWLDEFDEFPILDILPELQDILMASLQSSKKK